VQIGFGLAISGTTTIKANSGHDSSNLLPQRLWQGLEEMNFTAHTFPPLGLGRDITK